MSEYRSSYSGAQVDEAVAKALEPKVFWVELSGDYPNYTCTTNLSEIATAYNAGNQLYCRCSMGQYTAALPLFVPMPSINTWLFSGSGQLMGGGYEFPAQTFTIAISANGVVAEDTRLATGNSRLASPFELIITNGDTVKLKGFDFIDTNVFIFFNSSQVYLFGTNSLKKGDSGTTAKTGETVGNMSISNNNIATYTYTDNANNNIAYVGISAMCTDGANAFATLNEELPA